MNTTFERVSKKEGGTNEWLTPPQIIKALGEFDLDPCAPVTRPWDMAKKHYTIKDDGLLLTWEGRVWCNPPYGDEAKYWLAKCARHRNCIALTFARTETRMFFESVWPKAHAMFFFQGRLKFHRVTGEPGDSAGAPSVLIAYDQANAEALAKSGLSGKLVRMKGYDIPSADKIGVADDGVARHEIGLPVIANPLDGSKQIEGQAD